MSYSLATVSATSLQPPPSVYESSSCISEKAKSLEPEAPSRSYCLSSCSVETDTEEIGVVLGTPRQCCCASKFS